MTLVYQKQKKEMIRPTNKGRNAIPEQMKDDERYVLVFDFETTGLPHESVQWDEYQIRDTHRWYANGNPIRDPITGLHAELPASDASKWPHAVQMCYIMYDRIENTAKVVNEIIRLEEDIEMSAASEAIHKISKEYACGRTKRVINGATGCVEFVHHQDIGDVLRAFMIDFRKADVVVAHNMRFDRNILLAEMDRLRKRGIAEFDVYMNEVFDNKKEYCTANHGADTCRIVALNKYGKAYHKMPKLSSLYEYLFDQAPDETKLHDALIDTVICMRCFFKMRYDVDLVQLGVEAVNELFSAIHTPEGKKGLDVVRRSDRLASVEQPMYKETVFRKRKSPKKRN
jgi:DNA polymerase III epsilon subunit-like protein